MKVAIVGGSAKERESGGLLNLGREWEVWCLNLLIPQWLNRRYVRIDKMFHLHKRAMLEKDIPEHAAKFEEWCALHDEMEIVLADPWEKIPGATIFPREALAELPRGDYHCGSFDWMVAYAVHLGASEIFLTGICLRESGEPISSGPCLEYWCGYAEGRGIKVTSGKDCDMFYNYHLVKSRYVYGYDAWDLVEDRS